MLSIKRFYVSENNRLVGKTDNYRIPLRNVVETTSKWGKCSFAVFAERR